MSSLLDEVTEFCLKPLPTALDGWLDRHWKNVFERKNAENRAKYPLLTKLVKAAYRMEMWIESVGSARRAECSMIGPASRLKWKLQEKL